jgi:hypothetical protein
MFHLIYTSRQTKPFAPAELKKLLMAARYRNREADVTGMLVFHDGVFLQVLEGDEFDVRDIFTRIEKDPRHDTIGVLHRAATLGKRRLFGDWSMGFADAAGAAHILKGYIDIANSVSLSALDSTRALDLLQACGREPSKASA